jgi:signal transduction histidine kinase
MRLSLKAKLTAAISLLVLLVVLAISAVYLSRLARQALAEVARKGEDLSHEVYEQARSVLAHSELPPGTNPNDSRAVLAFVQSQLAQDPGLNTLLNSAVGYSATIYDVAITDANETVLVDSNPAEIGEQFEPPPPFSNLLNAGTFRQMEVIYGPPRVYEVTLPVALGSEPLTVRVGVSTIFLRQELSPELRRGLALAGLAILLATVTASLLSFGLLQPLETISRSVAQMASGENVAPLRLNRQDEWGILSSRLNLLGEQIRGEKSAYQKLKDNLDHLLANLADGLLLFDKEDRLVLATPTAARFLGTSAGTLMQRPVSEVFPANRTLDRTIREAFQSGRSSTWPSLFADGIEGISRVAASVQFAESNGERVGTLVTIRDASSRAELANQIDDTAKLAALSRITSGVAHEVKNPLNAMALQIELLKAQLAGQGTSAVGHLDVLSKEIQRLDRVVKTFLDFTRPVELHRVPTDVAKLVREVFVLAEPHANRNHVRMTLESDGALPAIQVDPDLLKQALLNLVLNGCQAMPSGGGLKVCPRASAKGIEIEISDQGVGILPAARSRIFELFFSTKPGGSGVGLAMAYRIIQLHNGSIDFTSEPNLGTTFHILLPV